MFEPIVYYRPLDLHIPDEEVVKALYLKLHERTLNYKYNDNEDVLKNYKNYTVKEATNYYMNGGLNCRGADISNLDWNEFNKGISILDVGWDGNVRSTAKLVNGFYKRTIIKDDEESFSGIDGCQTWCSFMQRRSNYIGVTYPDTVDKFDLRFRDDGRSGVWELSIENLTSVDSF